VHLRCSKLLSWNHTLTKTQLFLADDQTKFAKSIGWLAGMGDRNGRFAMVVDKDGKIVYAEKEKDPRQITVSVSSCGRLGRQVLTMHQCRSLALRLFFPSFDARRVLLN